jgi:hypothetical protein
LVIAWVFTIKSDYDIGETDYDIGETDYDSIIEWAKIVLPEGNMLKKNLYTAKSMMKLFGRGY